MAGKPWKLAIQARSRACGSNRCRVGRSTRGTDTLWLGAMTVARPPMTCSPVWFTTLQSSTTRRWWSSFDTTVSTTVRVSPTRTGRRKRSVCST